VIERVFPPTLAVRGSLLVLGLVVVTWAFPPASVAGVNPCGQSDVQAACQIKTMLIHTGP
jgi:hypothetical protein